LFKQFMASKIELLTAWKKLFKNCITPRTTTQKWKHSMVTALHGEKGNINDSNKIWQHWKAFHSVLTGLISKRLQAITENCAMNDLISNHKNPLCVQSQTFRVTLHQGL
jgi:hypothetical protein